MLPKFSETRPVNLNKISLSSKLSGQKYTCAPKEEYAIILNLPFLDYANLLYFDFRPTGGNYKYKNLVYSSVAQSQLGLSASSALNL